MSVIRLVNLAAVVGAALASSACRNANETALPTILVAMPNMAPDQRGPRLGYFAALRQRYEVGFRKLRLEKGVTATTEVAGKWVLDMEIRDVTYSSDTRTSYVDFRFALRRPISEDRLPVQAATSMEDFVWPDGQFDEIPLSRTSDDWIAMRQVATGPGCIWVVFVGHRDAIVVEFQGTE